jgi:hypothetical protein
MRRAASTCRSGFRHSGLGVELVDAEAHDHIAGLVAGIDAHARVALFLGKVK